MKKYCIWLLVFCFFSACRSPEKEEKDKKSLPVHEDRSPSIGSVQSTSSNGLNYSYYIPKDSFPHKHALIFFDPHGDGSFPVTKYKNLADEFHVILVGSNDSKNGLNLEDLKPLSYRLVGEVLSRFVPEKISLAGFSGGAKVALISASSDERIHSVICAGAALPSGSVIKLPPVLGIAGKMDMNYSDVISFLQSVPDSIPKAIVEWPGKHEWPDSSCFRHAFYWTELQSSGDSSLQQKFLLEQKKIVKKENDPFVKAELLSEAITLLHKEKDKAELKSLLVQVKKSSLYLSAKTKREKEMVAETQAKDEIGSALSTQMPEWWQQKINSLKQNNNALNERLLGYISLACYSLSGQALSAGDLSSAKRISTIYEWADPTNSEHAVIKAKIFMMENQRDSARFSLQKALDLGADRNRLMSEFPPELFK